MNSLRLEAYCRTALRILDEIGGRTVAFRASNSGGREYMMALQEHGVHVYECPSESAIACPCDVLCVCASDREEDQDREMRTCAAGRAVGIPVVVCVDSFQRFHERSMQRFVHFEPRVVALDGMMMAQLRRIGYPLRDILVSASPAWLTWRQRCRQADPSLSAPIVGLLPAHPMAYASPEAADGALREVIESTRTDLHPDSICVISFHPAEADLGEAPEDTGGTVVCGIEEVLCRADAVVAWDGSAIIKAVLSGQKVFRTRAGMRVGGAVSWGVFDEHICAFSADRLSVALVDRRRALKRVRKEE